MPRDYARPFAALFRPLTAAERTELTASIRQHGVRYPAKVYQSREHGRAVIDGANRLDICDVLGIACPVEDLGHLSEDTATELAEQLNHCRRHLSAGDWQRMAADRAERVKRVAERRRAGQSIRTIAADEGVSPGQVQRDLEAATVSGDTVLPDDNQIVGKDGVKRSATRPADEPELFAGEVTGEGDVNTEPTPPEPFTSPKGKPPPPKVEYPEPYQGLLDGLTELSRRFTLFVNSDDSERFREYVGELKLGWINYTKSKIKDGKKINPSFVAFQGLRQLLKLSCRHRKLPLKKVREYMAECHDTLSPMEEIHAEG